MKSQYAANLQTGFVSSHFLRLLQVMQPVFDPLFCTLDEISKLCIRCLRGRPRGLFGPERALQFSAVLIDSATCKPSIRTSSSGSSTFALQIVEVFRPVTRLIHLLTRLQQVQICSNDRSSQTLLGGSSERYRTTRSWGGMKEQVDVARNSAFVTWLDKPTQHTGGSQDAVPKNGGIHRPCAVSMRSSEYIAQDGTLKMYRLYSFWTVVPAPPQVDIYSVRLLSQGTLQVVL